MYCHLIATTGHSWDQVRNDWDLPRLEAWNRYCGDHPTVQQMVQAYLGIKPKATTENSDDLAGLLASLPNVTQKPST